MSASPARLRIHLLGGIRALFDGVLLPPPQRLETQRLWLYLLLHPAVILERSRIADELWPGAEAAHARFNLRHALHTLEQYLPEADPPRPWLLRSRRTLGWNPAADAWLDAAALQAAATQAATAEGGPDLLLALETAADLYQGPLLPGYDEEWVAAPRAAAEAACITVLLRWLDILEDAQRLDEAVRVARRWITLDPGNEASHRRLMRLHARRGDRAAALRQFESCRQWLRHELDVDPSPETRALAEALQMTHLDGAEDGPAAGADDATRAARSAATTRSVIERPSPPPAGFPAGRGGPQARPFAALVDRQARVAEGVRLLATTRLLTATGPPGVGKSRLGAEIARAVVARYPAGIWWADLADGASGAAAETVIGRALGHTDSGNPPLLARLSHRTGEVAGLLVLDNAERVIEWVAEWAPEALAACRHLSLLVTSREVLRLAEEVVWRVVPLAVASPTAGAVAGSWRPSEAAELLLDRSRGSGITPARTAEDAAVVEELCRRLDGLPLALELAAGLLRSRSPVELLACLDAGLDDLATSPPTSTARHRSLVTAVAASLDALSAVERAFLDCLADAPGALTLDEVERRWHAPDADGAARPDAIPLLTRLVDKSLVEVEPRRDRRTRYRLLHVVRRCVGGQPR